MERLPNNGSPETNGVNGAEWVYFERAVASGKPPPDKDEVQQALRQIGELYGMLGVPRRSRALAVAALEGAFYSGDRLTQIDAARRIIDVRDGMGGGVQAIGSNGKDPH